MESAFLCGVTSREQITPSLAASSAARPCVGEGAPSKERNAANTAGERGPHLCVVNHEPSRLTRQQQLCHGHVNKRERVAPGSEKLRRAHERVYFTFTRARRSANRPQRDGEESSTGE